MFFQGGYASNFYREIEPIVRRFPVLAVHRIKANLEVYLSNPVGIGEHPDIIAAMEAELEQLAKWDDNFEMIKKYLDK